MDTKIAGDIAITAAEGGIGYWSQIEEYDYRRWTGTEDDDFASIEVPRDFVFYRIHRINNSESGYEADCVIQLGVYGKLIFG